MCSSCNRVNAIAIEANFTTLTTHVMQFIENSVPLLIPLSNESSLSRGLLRIINRITEY